VVKKPYSKYYFANFGYLGADIHGGYDMAVYPHRLYT
jgi:hypothetical protein